MRALLLGLLVLTGCPELGGEPVLIRAGTLDGVQMCRHRLDNGMLTERFACPN